MAHEGESPLGSDELLSYLDGLGIEHTTLAHPPVYTVEQAERLRGGILGASVKNLFLRDKKRRYFLLVAPAAKTVVLRTLRRAIGASGNLSFASAEALGEVLGVEPGAVTPLAAINDRERRVTVVIDRELLECEWLAVHPLRCDMTTSLKTAGLLRFLDAVSHPPAAIDV